MDILKWIFYVAFSDSDNLDRLSRKVEFSEEDGC